jgi:hypothetical protein
MTRRTPTVGLRVVAAALTLTLAGCTGTPEAPTADDAPESSPPPSRAPSPTPSPSPSEEATEEPTGEPADDPTGSVPTAGPPVSPRGADATLADRLLTAEQMPGFNDEWTWRVRSTRDREGGRPFATCHRFPMTSIGAMRVAVRSYEGTRSAEEGVTGSHLVARFADAKTARTAYDVLRSWRERCAEQLAGFERNDVGALETVDVPAGEGGWYLLTYGPPEDGIPEEAYFDAQGIAHVGKRVAVLQMRAIGQDYNYPAGEEPMVAGVRRAAAELR